MLFVGVAPDGKPVGINVDGEALASLRRTVNSVHDGDRYEIIPIEVGDRWVVVISIARREQGFAQTTEGQVVVRRDAMNTSLIGQRGTASSLRRSPPSTGRETTAQHYPAPGSPPAETA